MTDSEDHLVPYKRPRGLSPEPQAAEFPSSRLLCLVENAERDKAYWLRDGNLILVTDLRRTAFRIYKDLLARQSGTFDDMFASSSPEDKELYEGCPVVERSDAPEDLRHLLAVLLPTTKPSYVHLFTMSFVFRGNPFPVIRRFCQKKGDPLPSLYAFSAIIRLSHKYNIQHLEEQALNALKKHYCDTLNAYDERAPVFEASQTIGDTHRAYMVEVIELARLTNTPSLLPLRMRHSSRSNRCLRRRVAEGGRNGRPLEHG
ncbi:hypothetical protein K466DRAFT_498434 [Polyporus arcularius HHB13444]|uniref:BTB domain-containing protein n=1 Tax=Polyporus arcularius HHB13444 TaxID=1314778 RepID=A0A5C3P5A3_9APHY|nr:hypothetical protein K466DRAFT_498434 [Polyporus arcularius HHB13444]